MQMKTVTCGEGSAQTCTFRLPKQLEWLFFFIFKPSRSQVNENAPYPTGPLWSGHVALPPHPLHNVFMLIPVLSPCATLAAAARPGVPSVHCLEPPALLLNLSLYLLHHIYKFTRRDSNRKAVFFF